MPCEEGQNLQDEFDKAVAARIQIELRDPRTEEAKDARVSWQQNHVPLALRPNSSNAERQSL